MKLPQLLVGRTLLKGRVEAFGAGGICVQSDRREAELGNLRGEDSTARARGRGAPGGVREQHPRSSVGCVSEEWAPRRPRGAGEKPKVPLGWQNGLNEPLNPYSHSEK